MFLLPRGQSRQLAEHCFVSPFETMSLDYDFDLFVAGLSYVCNSWGLSTEDKSAALVRLLYQYPKSTVNTNYFLTI